MIADDISIVDITMYGEALSSRGFEVRGAIEGLGLLTFGNVWNCAQIWTSNINALTTSWGPYSGISPATSWTAATGASTTTTTWTPRGPGFTGEC